MILKPRLFRKPRKGHWATKGLKFLMLGNEGSGDKVFDLSGNGNTGTLVADTHFVPGKFGSALDFDGTGDYVLLSRAAGLDNFPFSLVAIVSVSDLSGHRAYFDQSYSNTVYQGLVCGILADGRIYTRLGDGLFAGNANRYSVYSIRTLSLNTTYHIAIICHSISHIDIYINGVEVSTTTAGTASSYAPGTENGRIGMGYVGLEVWQGKIEYINSYNRALSVSEVAELHREPFGMFERDSIELWVGATSVGEVEPPTGIAAYTHHYQQQL